MAILYKIHKDSLPFDTEGPSLTEQEHKDSCDINKMIQGIKKGLAVRGGPEPTFGYDDVTLDTVQHLIIKQQIEADLHKAAQSLELSEEEIKHVPPHVQKKFGFKTRKKVPPTEAPKNELNDPKATDPAPKPPEPKPNS